MHYNQNSNFKSLQEGYSQALRSQKNVVLQAGSLKDQTGDFAKSIVTALQKKPSELECRFLYDEHGSALYEKICEQPEYYLTRTEAGILKEYAGAICDHTGLCTLVELGSGSSVKTDYLLSAYQKKFNTLCYSPIDISASALKYAGRAITQRRPKVQFVGVHGTFDDAFSLFGCSPKVMTVFLGSTIGNLTPVEEESFWGDVSENLKVGDYFLLGIDLVKDRSTLEAAYNDKAGVTAAFTKNYFGRMNRELGSSIDLDQIEHIAFYNKEKSQIEVYLEFLQDQAIDLNMTDQSFSFAKGERVLIEISRKFEFSKMSQLLDRFGLQTIKTFTDQQKWFGLLLLQKVSR